MDYIFNDTIVSWQYSMIQLYWAKPKAKAKAKPKAKPRAKEKPKANPKARAKTKGKGKAKGEATGKGKGKGNGKGKAKGKGEGEAKAKAKAKGNAKGQGQGQSQRPNRLIGELPFSNSLFLRSTPLAPRQGLFEISQNVTNRINLHGREPGKRESAEKGGPQPGPARGSVVVVNSRIPASTFSR